MADSDGGSFGNGIREQSPWLENYGPRLKAIAAERGLNQTQLGVLAGVSQSHVSKVLNGKSPAFTSVVRVAMALDVSLDKLCGIAQADPISALSGPALNGPANATGNVGLTLRVMRIEALFRWMFGIDLQQGFPTLSEDTGQATERRKPPLRRRKKK